MALLLADGQLGASSGTILGIATGERTVAVTLHNTSEGVEQTVALTVTRSGSSARTVARALLKGRWTLYVVGLPLDPSDVLSGSASYGSTVDYLVAQSAGPFGIFARDKNGAPVPNGDIELTVSEKFGLSRDGMEIVLRLDEIRDLLLKIA